MRRRLPDVRGFYAVAATVFADNGDDTRRPADFGCVLLHVAGSTWYLHSATSPNIELEALGGTLEAATWAALHANVNASVRNNVFRTLVDRDVGPQTVRLFIPAQAVRGTDTVISTGLPPHKFMGDAEPDPIP